MSEEAETIERLRLQGNGFVASSHVAKVIERIIKERDEARRELDELDFLRYEEIEKAEARGYQRGVEDAENAVKKLGFLCREDRRDTRTTIRALLEQTSDSSRPHLQSGAGHEKKI
jgi:hypothetical protein